MFDERVNRGLVAAVSLLNTSAGPKNGALDPDSLETAGALGSFLEEQDPVLQWPSSEVDEQQLEKVLQLRGTVQRIWESAPAADSTGVELVNELLEGVGTRLVSEQTSNGPRFYEVATPASSELHDMMTASIAVALVRVMVADGARRLLICRGGDCQAALVDLTRNRTKLFCDYGNCGNRSHVRAYRDRQAAAQKRARAVKHRPKGVAAKPSRR